MFCLKCFYDLRGSTELCPECGRAFDRHDAATWSEYSIPRRDVLILKFFVLFDRWWFYAGCIVAWSLWAYFAEKTWQRIEFGFFAALSLWCLVRHFIRGSEFRKRLEEARK